MKLKLLFAAALILLLSTVRAQCPTSTIPSGTGTLSDPYQIATFSNLRWLSETPAVWGAGTYFIQTANIDASCTSDPSYNAGAGFSPIGLATTQFQGNYDGQGYFISNIFINRSVCYVGVFGYANNAQITNLNIQNCNISSTCRVGGLIGQGMNVTVSNCHVNGNVSCGSSGYVGGLAAIISTGNITNCSANVQVSTTQNYAGCLIGWANACTITNCWSGGSASASDMVGGFIGQLSSSLSLVSSCYTTASATITAPYFRVGGFVGRVQNGRITKSYASGHVTGILSSGGFVSIIEAGCTVDSCYFNGQVSGGANGFCYFNSGTINSCYWDIDASGVTVSNGGIGLTTCQMKTTGTFESDGWRFPAVWTQNATDNNGYPALAWQSFPHNAIDTLEIISASQINTTCSSAINGSATVTLTGGTGTRTYSWSPSGGSSSTASNLTTGSYTVTVTDANTCSVSQTFSIVNGDSIPPQLYYITCSSNSNASGTAYSDGWQNGDNDGSGFNAWTLNASTGNTSQAGFLRGSSITNGAGVDNNGDGDINSGGFALGLYANSAQATEAIRPFPTALAANSILQIEFDNGNVAPGQIVGFQLQNSSGNSLGEVRYRGGQATYEIVDANGITPFSSIPFTDEGIIISVKSISTGIVQITLTRKLDGVSQTLTSNLFPGGGNQLIRRFKVFNSNAGSGLSNTLFVNNFSICSVTNGCPSNVSAFSSSGTCNATVTFPSIAAVDNCDGNVSVIQTSGLPSGSSFPVGTTINTFSATDGNGNTSTCSFNVIVQDTVRPTANCQNLTLHLNTSGNASLIPAMVNNGSSDACSIASMSVSPNSFSCANVGSNTVTLTVTDASGNSSTCTSIVTVVDTVRPVVNTQNITLQLNAAGTSSIIPAMVNNGSTDACGIASMSVSPNSFSCANIGANTVTLTVTDVNGNSRTGTAIVTVADTVRPTVNCQNLTLHLNASGNASLVPAMVNNGSSDACGIASMTVIPSTFSCANRGANNVTLTVTDVNGNSSTCTSIVTVVDTIRPVLNCQNVNAYLNSSGQVNILMPILTSSNSFTDNCNSVSWSASPMMFSCSNVGPNTVTINATDDSGNMSSCMITATVIDTIRPVVNTQNLTLHLNAAGNASVIPAMVNNGSTDACGIASMSLSPNSFSCANIGANTVTLTVTDVNGNSNTGNAIVTVADTVRPVAIAQNVTVTLSGGTATVNTAAVNNGSTDACGIGSLSVSPNTFTCANLGPNTVTLTVTDVNGNSSTTTAIVTVLSNLTAAMSVNNNVSCFGGSNGQAVITPSGGAGPFTYSWTPSGGTGSTSTGLIAGSYTCAVTDAGGCTTSQTVNITQPTQMVAASSAGSILCNGGTTAVTVTSSGGISPYSGTGTFTETAGTHTYTVTDANGCTSSTSITITEPTLLVASSSATSILCNGGNATVTVGATGGTTSYSGTGTFTVNAGTYSYTITDANGCTDTTSITVSEPTALTAASSASTLLCNGDTSTVTVTASGGVSPYSGAGTFNQIAGTYTFTVTDNNGCTSTTSVTITEPTAISTSVASTNVLCNGDSTGSIDLTVSGGTAPYTFNWNSGAFTTEDLTNIPAGSYSGVLTDANGCQDSGTVVINEPAVLAATAVATNPTGCTTNDGSIDLSVAGGTPGYAYVWSTTATTEDVTALDGGVYTVTVTDTNGCSVVGSFTLTEPGAPTVTFSAGLDTVCQSTTAPFTLTGSSPAGGVFSGTGMINDTVFDPMTANIGFNVITYTYTDAGGCTGSAVDSILVDICTGTALNIGTSSFSIFPNPNNGAFTVITSTYADMMIYDAQGKLVAAQKVQANVQNQINIESSGMYMITIVAADGSRTTQRVVVTK